MRFQGWFVKITTTVGQLMLPFGESSGYKTKRQAEEIADRAKVVQGVVKAEVIKG